MNPKHNPIKDQCIRTMTDGKAYKSQNRNYLASLMKATPQEELIEYLNDLDYYQLKVAVGCGIPGHAQPLSLIRLKKLRDEVDQYVRSKKEASEATFTVKVGKEDKDESTKGIRTSKEGRTENSGKMGEESSDSGT